MKIKEIKLRDNITEQEKIRNEFRFSQQKGQESQTKHHLSQRGCGQFGQKMGMVKI